MAKMFYSLEEAASRLKKSTDEVQKMAGRGEIREYRDGDRLIFKVDEIDLLAPEDPDAADMSSMIPLTDTSSGSMAIDLTDSGFGTSGASGSGSLGLGGSALGGSGMLDDVDEAIEEDEKEATGISVFDADDLDNADPSAVTQVSDGGGFEGLQLDSMGSGSGLMDLTRESDDTSLGAEGLLDDIFSGEEAGMQGSSETVADADSGLFEGAAGEADADAEAVEGAGGLVAVAPEMYDGRGSGLAGGLSLGMMVALLFALTVILMGMIGAPLPLDQIPVVGTNILMLVGILAGATLLFGGVGFALGGRGK